MTAVTVASCHHSTPPSAFCGRPVLVRPGVVVAPPHTHRWLVNRQCGKGSQARPRRRHAKRKVVSAVLLPVDSDGHISDGSSRHHGSSGTEGASSSSAALEQQQQQHLRLLSSVYQAPGSMASFLKRSVVGVFSLQAAAPPGLAEEDALAKASQLVARQPPRAKASAAAVASSSSSPEAVVLQPQEEPSGKKQQRHQGPKEQSKAQRETKKKGDGWEEEEEEEEEERPMVDISNFLKTSGTLETRYMRMLASLCALTYVMPTLTPRKLFRMHQLNLVTTSRACELPAPGSKAAAEQQKLRKAAKEAAAAKEDESGEEEGSAAFYDDPCMGMDSIVTASCSPDWESFGNNNSEEEEQEEAASGAAKALEGAVSNITPLSGRLRSASPVDGGSFSSSSSSSSRGPPGGSDKQQQQQLQAAALVGRKLGEAAAAAAALGGRAGSAAAAFTIARTPFARSVAEQLEHAAEEGGISNVATELMMTHGVEMAASALSGAASEDPVVSSSSSSSSGGGKEKKEGGLEEEGGPSPSGSCPCEWFVADDPVSHTRYIVIQGSDNLESWITNVTFDPVPFEGPELGVKVHRGVYNAAHALYGRFLPLINDHLDSSPFATVSFTGHSLGGALATVLLLMYTARGVLRRSSISPCYTFGGAAVFCERGGVKVTEVDGNDVTASQEEAATDTLLDRVGLSDGAVRNVVLNNDIVPRAFACDYSLVASILGSIYAAFRDHTSLHSARGVLYSFVGRMMVLQPDPDLKFASPEGPHPMLPPGPGLYTMRSPTLLSGKLQPQQHHLSALVAEEDENNNKQQQQQQQQPQHQVTALSSAVMAFMDYPHPLDTLKDHRAYGTDGSISRYHNPDHYTQALGAVLRERRRSSAFAESVAVSIGLQHRAMKMMRGGLDSLADSFTELRRRSTRAASSAADITTAEGDDDAQLDRTRDNGRHQATDWD